jgi:hypothetical protein
LFYSLFKNVVIYSDSEHLKKTIQFGLSGLFWALLGSLGCLGSLGFPDDFVCACTLYPFIGDDFVCVFTLYPFIGDDFVCACTLYPFIGDDFVCACTLYPFIGDDFVYNKPHLFKKWPVL